MSYAIIGSGSIGHALAKHFARQGIEVLVANKRGPASLGDLVRELGPNVRATSVDDALQADVVFLAVPFGAVAELGRSGRSWSGRIVVDATNAVDFPSFTPSDLGGRLSTEVVSDAVPGARVVKAFNTLPAAILASEPTEHGGRRVVFLSGNDADANHTIVALVERLGFAAVNLGTLADGGRTQQFGGALVAIDLAKHLLPRRSH
jgi:8-hydroxy-5-deazaflavin:NADPH oxidoreductase